MVLGSPPMGEDLAVVLVTCMCFERGGTGGVCGGGFVWRGAGE